MNSTDDFWTGLIVGFGLMVMVWSFLIALAYLLLHV